MRETEVKNSVIEIILVKKILKNTMPDGELVTAGYVSVVYVCRFCIKSSGRLVCNFLFVGPGEYPLSFLLLTHSSIQFLHYACISEISRV